VTTVITVKVCLSQNVKLSSDVKCQGFESVANESLYFVIYIFQEFGLPCIIITQKKLIKHKTFNFFRTKPDNNKLFGTIRNDSLEHLLVWLNHFLLPRIFATFSPIAGDKINNQLHRTVQNTRTNKNSPNN